MAGRTSRKSKSMMREISCYSWPVFGQRRPNENAMSEEKICYTYIVRCADGSLYTGWTDDLEGRVRAHNSGHGAKYTRPRRPVELVYYETFATKEEAMSREWHIKHLTREEKLGLIGEPKREE